MMMIKLAAASVRRRAGAFAGTFLTAFLAIMLIAASGLLLYSVLTAGPGADRFAAADAVVAGDRSVVLTTEQDKGDKVKTKTKTERLTGAAALPADFVGKVASTPGVAEAIADSAFPVTVDKVSAVAHGWGSARLTPYTGTAPKPGEVVLDAALVNGLSVGDTVRLTSKTGTHELRLAGFASGAVPGQVFIADEQIRAVSALAGPTAIGVLAAPGVDREALFAELRKLSAVVYTGADKVNADLPGALPDYIGAISIFGFVLGITGFAAVFVLTGTVSLAVRQRLRELALLRTAGATPRQLRRMLGAEIAMVTVVAAVPGLPLSIVVADLIAARFRDLGAVPSQFSVSLNAVVLVAAVVVGLLVTQLAAFVAARRTVKIAPTQALSETVTTAGGGWVLRVVVAAVLTAGAVAVLAMVPLGGVYGMGMGFVSCSLLLCAVAALGPILIRALTAVLSRLVALTGVMGQVAASMSRAEIGRIAGVALPLTLMFAINATMLLNGDIVARVTADQQAARTAQATAQLPGAMPFAEAEKVSSRPDVTGAALTVPTRVILDEGGKPEDHPAQGLRLKGESPLDLGVVAGALTDLRPGTVAASVPLAEQRGWRIGDQPRVWLADGTQRTVTVVAIYELWRGFGELVLPADEVVQHDPRGLVGAVYLRGGTGGTVAAAPAADAANQQGAWELMVVISIGFTAIAVANTFAISTSARRREFAGLRLTGATARQLHRMVGRETLIAVAVALVIGCVLTGGVVGAFSVAQDGQWRLFADPLRYLGMIAGVGALGVIAGAVPARLVIRRRSLPDLTS
jgi:putative ABC transport system permease protein